jgi:hypothetical protein
VALAASAQIRFIIFQNAEIFSKVLFSKRKLL